LSQETATFGAGCFWGVEAKFADIPGVIETAVGYAGGSLDHPTYKEVCTDRTGHAEVVQVVFDPARVSFEALLEEFFRLHDPTQLNRQGPDWGSQYRSVVFYYSQEQMETAQRKIEELKVEGVFPKPIVTQLTPAGSFWRAEEYHQKYLEKRGMTQCHI
jgi:peptide-methionine (S)-S-oxide reductase